MPEFFADFLIAGRKQTLVFRSVITPAGCKYFVRALDEIENPVSFEMKEQTIRQWRILAPAPLWALRIEQQLSAAIVENNGSKGK